MSGGVCILATILWLRSLWALDCFRLTTQYHANFVASAAGGIFVERIRLVYWQPEWMTQQGVAQPNPKSDWSWEYGSAEAADVDNFLGWPDAEADRRGKLGFKLFTGELENAFSSSPLRVIDWIARIPWWSIVLPTAILPAIGLIEIATSKKQYRQGRCPHCGYDVRATPNRCPECGFALRP